MTARYIQPDSVTDEKTNDLTFPIYETNRQVIEHANFMFVVLSRKMTTSQIYAFYDNKWLCVIELAIVYCVGVNERENPISGMELFQSNIYYYVRIKGVLIGGPKNLIMII